MKFKGVKRSKRKEPAGPATRMRGVAGRAHARARQSGKFDSGVVTDNHFAAKIVGFVRRDHVGETIVYNEGLYTPPPVLRELVGLSKQWQRKLHPKRHRQRQWSCRCRRGHLSCRRQRHLSLRSSSLIWRTEEWTSLNPPVERPRLGQQMCQGHPPRVSSLTRVVLFTRVSGPWPVRRCATTT